MRPHQEMGPTGDFTSREGGIRTRGLSVPNAAWGNLAARTWPPKCRVSRTFPSGRFRPVTAFFDSFAHERARPGPRLSAEALALRPPQRRVSTARVGVMTGTGGTLQVGQIRGREQTAISRRSWTTVCLSFAGLPCGVSSTETSRPGSRRTSSTTRQPCRSLPAPGVRP